MKGRQDPKARRPRLFSDYFLTGTLRVNFRSQRKPIYRTVEANFGGSSTLLSFFFFFFYRNHITVVIWQNQKPHTKKDIWSSKNPFFPEVTIALNPGCRSLDTECVRVCVCTHVFMHVHTCLIKHP